jgi:hypothetical protein
VAPHECPTTVGFSRPSSPITNSASSSSMSIA